MRVDSGSYIENRMLATLIHICDEISYFYIESGEQINNLHPVAFFGL